MDLFDLFLHRAASFIPILLSLTVHEWAHAWTAWKLGDDTAKMLGRVSLNPIDHIDPVGTLLLPLLGIPFGWARPVPVVPTRFHTSISMPLGMLLTASAGPISNLILAMISASLLLVLSVVFPTELARPEFLVVVITILKTFVLVNVLLACFNLIPIPPLDGSQIVNALVPPVLRPYWERFSALGPILILALILLPFMVGFNLLAWPLYWTNALLNRITG